MKRTLYKIRCSEKINNVRIIHGWLDFESDLRIIAEDMVQDFNENRRPEMAHLQLEIIDSTSPKFRESNYAPKLFMFQDGNYCGIIKMDS